MHVLLYQRQVWGGLTTERGEECIEARGAFRPSGQPVIHRYQLWSCLSNPAQCDELIHQHIQSEPCICHWIVLLTALELAILVVLDQVVVRVARESQWVQPQGVHRGAERHPKVMKLWKGDKIKPLVNIQRDLLRRAAQFLQPGGRLVYSTCTTNSAENEDQVAWACETLGLRAEAFADPSGAGGREA